MIRIIIVFIIFGKFIEISGNTSYNKSTSLLEESKPTVYAYRYSIDHPTSGVIIDHWEDRNGDHVIGRYGLLEPNGMIRTVYYEVNGNDGFRSIIKTRLAGNNMLKHQKFNHRQLSQPKVPFRHVQPITSSLLHKN